MITRSFLQLSFIFFLCGSVVAEVRLANESKFPIFVELQGRGESSYRKPFTIKARSIGVIPVKPDAYRIRIQQDDGKGKRQTLPLRDYSNPNKTYFLSLCAICAPVLKDDKRLKPVPSKSNFSSDDTKTLKLLPAFSSRGAYRFGAAAINDAKGVRVTAVEVNSPSYKLRCTTDNKLYYLVVENSIITHVNEEKIRNAKEFEDAIATSKRFAKLRIYSTTRHRTVDFWADLRE